MFVLHYTTHRGFIEAFKNLCERCEFRKTYCFIIILKGPRAIRLDPERGGSVCQRNIFNWPERNAHRPATVRILYKMASKFLICTCVSFAKATLFLEGTNRLVPSERSRDKIYPQAYKNHTKSIRFEFVLRLDPV